MDERARRLVAAAEAARLGYGGVSHVSRLTGLSRVSIHQGMKDMRGAPLPSGRLRRPGAGRPGLGKTCPGLVPLLEGIVEPSVRGDLESPLRWTCKSTRRLAAELKKAGASASHTKVAKLLAEQGYSLQANRKVKEGDHHADRDAQFRHINEKAGEILAANLPVISVDTKKKEVLGDFANKGRQWKKTKCPEHVKSHDFPDPSLPRAFPYGIYDIGKNSGFVNVGTDHDTSAFAVASIRGWWAAEGCRLYASADRILITADAGGSNGFRRWQWKSELQKLADELRMEVSVCHFPPGTSKWNKVEHRLFSFISSNWRGQPLRDYETIVNLIANTTTAKGLTVSCRLDHSKYPVGQKIPKEEIDGMDMAQDTFHGEWNYTLRPRSGKANL